MKKDTWSILNMNVNSAAAAVEKAKAGYDSLVNKKAEADRRISELAQERKRLSFSALADEDAEAQKQLKALNLEAVTENVRHENLLHALDQSRTLLSDAEAAHFKALVKLQAHETLSELTKLADAAREIDNILKQFVSNYPTFNALATKVLAAAGREHSSAYSAARVFGNRALTTALIPVAHSLGLENWYLAPRDRVTFEKVVQEWGAAISAACHKKLEEPNQ